MKKRILITVKTYPTISSKYSELVCTAGITEEGEWVRLYPVPFRKMDFDQRFRKYQWVEVEVEKNRSDFRPESYRPVDYDSLSVLASLDTANNWQERKQLVLRNVYDDMQALVRDAKDPDKYTSLAVFKPTNILDFVVTQEKNPHFTARQIARADQGDLFGGENPFRTVQKLPFRFHYIFEDIHGKKSRLMIEDWEVGQLYWKSLERKKQPDLAVADVINKFKTEFLQKNEIYFFLGTTLEWHRRGPNPFIIIGVFYPKKGESQQELFGPPGSTL
ncbi:MAG: hypothetical protein KDK33_15915 [Leptospiraceae bacterium]|nr:hypothetical protein [Leptospiraceae bacterium]